VAWPRAPERIHTSRRRVDVQAAPALAVEPVRIGEAPRVMGANVDIGAWPAPLELPAQDHVLALLREGQRGMCERHATGCEPEPGACEATTRHRGDSAEMRVTSSAG